MSQSYDEEPSKTVSEELIDGRRSVYGQPTDTFARMAQMISGLLGTEVQSWQVPLIMIITKMVRTNQCPTYSDNSDDIDGYMVIFRELIGDDMIHARTVDEYLQKKAGGSSAQPEQSWPLELEQVQSIVKHLFEDGTREGLLYGDALNKAMGASARRRAGEQS